MPQVRWLAESIRISFLGQIERLGVPVFEAITGSMPLEQMSRPQQRLYTESGPYDGQHFLAVSQQPGRIDILMTDDPNSNTVDLSLPTYKNFFEIGDYLTASQIARGFAGKFLNQGMIKIAKLAFAPILLAPTVNPEEANKVLQAVVPSFQINPARDNSVLFQINRPRPSLSIGDVEINRLMKWQTLDSQIMSFGPNPAVVPMNLKAAVRVEMDINGPSNAASALLSRQLSEMFEFFDELVGLAAEISAQGDVP